MVENIFFPPLHPWLKPADAVVHTSASSCPGLAGLPAAAAAPRACPRVVDEKYDGDDDEH